MKQEIKTYIKVFLIGLVLSILISSLRSGTISIGGMLGLGLSSFVGFLIYFFTIIYFLKRNKSKVSNFKLVISFAIGVSLISLISDLLYFSAIKRSFLETLIHLSSILLGYTFYMVKNQLLRVFILVFGFAFAFWMSTDGYALWINKLTTGSYSGRIENMKRYEFSFENTNGDTIHIADFKGKYLFLECWYTGCGLCYKEMPNVQKLYDKYKNNTEIQFFALHSRMEKHNETY